MPDLETLSAKKLHDVVAKRCARWGELLKATIDAGLGQARFTDMVELARGSSLLFKTKLAQDYLNARRDYDVALTELDRRKRYHGGDKPIKKSA